MPLAFIPTRRWVKGTIFAILVGLAGTVTGISSLGLSLETNVGLSWLFNLRGPVAAPDNVAVVAITERGAGEMDLPSSVANWPRSVHGELIEELVDRGASAIVFDVFFRSLKDVADDGLLASAMEASDRVVLVQQLTGKREPLFDDTGRVLGSIWKEELIPPDDIFRNTARGVAPFPLPKVDAAVYEFWTYKDSAGFAPTMPAMALQVHALPYYEQWYNLALNAGLPMPGSLSPPALQAAGADSMSEILKAWRALFQQYPQAAERIASMIEESSLAPGVDANSVQMQQALLALFTRNDHRYINFYGPPGTITNIPYENLFLDNPVPPVPDLTGKVVFVGYSDLYDPGQPDRFYTVFTGTDGVDLSGVEIAATAFGNLSTDSSLELMALGSSAMTLFALGFVFFALLYFFPAQYSVPVVFLIAALYVYLSLQAFTQQTLWMPLAVPMLVQLPAALLFGLMAQYLLERQRGQRISEAIAYYLPENIARELSHKKLDPSSVNNVVFSTCLATDMAGFSTIAEGMSPGELATFLNEYFEVLATPLKKYDVDLTEFRADAIMCAWTGEESAINVRLKPIQAALDAVKAIDVFKEHHTTLSSGLRVGLESGSVYIGHAGGGGHFVYSIVGDCANTASRIEGLNKHLGTQLLATDKVISGLEDRLIMRPLGDFRFVGKGGGLPIFQILGLTGDDIPDIERFLAHFADALALYRDGEWDKARAAFVSYSADFPADGPARFYTKLCEKYAAENYINDEPGLVKMDQK